MFQRHFWPGFRGPSVAELWGRLESYLEAHAPSVLASLNPPATDEQIDQAEARLGRSITADLRESLRVHDGQSGLIPIVPAEFDPSRNATIATWGELLSLEEIMSHTLREWSAIETLGAWPDDFAYDGPVRRDGRWSCISIVDPGSGDRIWLDLAPGDGGQFGQVLAICHDPSQLFVIATSYRAWFERLVERYESGRYHFIEESGRYSPRDRIDSN